MCVDQSKLRAHFICTLHRVAINYDSIRAALTQTACRRNEKHLLSPSLALATPELWKAVYGQTVKGDPQENPRESNKETQAGCSARE